MQYVVSALAQSLAVSVYKILCPQLNQLEVLMCCKVFLLFFIALLFNAAEWFAVCPISYCLTAMACWLNSFA